MAYRAQATQQAIRFQRYAETAFQEKMERDHARAIAKVKHDKAVKITGHILDGKTQSHAEKRVDLTDTFKQLSAIIIKLSSPAMIGRVVGKEYILLFGMMAEQLKRALNNSNVRDGLPELQLSHLKLAEESLVMILSQKQELTEKEILEIVEKTVKPLAEHLKMVCDTLGIDIATGKPTLQAGAK